MKQDSGSLINQNSVFVWIAVATGALLLVPLVAMQLTDEVNWRPADFAVMGALLFVMASLFVLVAKRIRRRYRPVAGALIAAAFLYVWAELAVGITLRSRVR